MPDRYVSDTSSKCMTLTQSRWVTTWVDSCYSIIDLIGGQNTTGGAIARDTLGMAILIEAARVGSSVNFALIVEPGIEQEFTFDIAYVNSSAGSLLAIEDSVAGQWKTLNSVPLDKRGNIRLPFVSLLGNVRVSVTGPTKTVLNRICRKVPVQYQESYLTQVCNGDKDRYRFGFNGQEKVNEIAGVGNHNTAEFWEYDTRVARRWNLDPEFKQMPGLSHYSAFNNSPLIFVDEGGDLPIIPILYFIGKAFLVGAAVDAGTQVVVNKVEGKSWKEAVKFDYRSAAISGGFNVVTAGVGSFVGGTKVATQVTKAVITTSAEVGESVAKQSIDKQTDGAITLSKTLEDVVTSKVLGAATKNVNANNIKAAERKLDNATRVSNGKPSSSGRLKTKIDAEKGLKQEQIKAKSAEEAVNMSYEAIKSGITNDNKGFSYPTNSSLSPSDNTRVVQPLYIR
jgi:hypothetical protein